MGPPRVIPQCHPLPGYSGFWNFNQILLSHVRLVFLSYLERELLSVRKQSDLDDCHGVWSFELRAFTGQRPCLALTSGYSPLSHLPPFARESKGREPQEAFRLMFFSGIPLYLEQKFLKGSKSPSATIWKFPKSPYLCCVCFGRQRRCPQINESLLKDVLKILQN